MDSSKTDFARDKKGCNENTRIQIVRQLRYSPRQFDVLFVADHILISIVVTDDPGPGADNAYFFGAK